MSSVTEVELRRLFRRAAAAAGPTGVVLVAAGLLLPGAPVRTDEPVTDIVRILATRHVALALSVFLAGLGLLAICIFAGALHQFLTAGDCEVAGFGAATATVSGAVLIVVGMAVVTGLTLNPAVFTNGDLAVVRAAVDIGNVLIGLAKFAFAGTIVCVIAGGSHLLGRRMRTSGAVAALASVASALLTLLTASGVGQFGGPVDLAGSGLALLWIFALSAVVTARVPSLDNVR